MSLHIYEHSEVSEKLNFYGPFQNFHSKLFMHIAHYRIAFMHS